MAKRNDPVSVTPAVDTPSDGVLTAELVETGTLSTVTTLPGGPMRIARDDLDAITSMEEALAILASHGIAPVDAASILADPWTFVAKDDLINTEFLVLDTHTTWGDYGPYVMCRIVTRSGRRLRFSDGSSGIFNQLNHLRTKYDIQNAAGMHCRKGLTKNTYTRRSEDGEPILNDHGMEEKATTFYFNTEGALPQID